MSPDDVAALRAVYDKWAQGDFWTPEIFDPEVVTIWTSDFPDLEPGIGLEGLASGIKDYLAAWTGATMEAEDFRVVGDKILVAIRLTATGRTTGIMFEDRRAHVWTMRSGKAIRIEGFMSVEDALASLGLQE